MTCGVTDAQNNDLIRRDPVEDKIGIGKRHNPSKAALADTASRVRVGGDELDDGVNATLDVQRAQRRMSVDVGEDILQLAESAGCTGLSQTVLRPERPDRLVTDKLAALGLSQRLIERPLLLVAHRDRR